MSSATPNPPRAVNGRAMTRLLERHRDARLLVLAQDISSVVSLQLLLTGHGLERVVCETDPVLLERRLAEVRPDLVVLDLNPDLIESLYLIARVRGFAGGAYLPVVVLTASTTTASGHRMLGLGAQAFLGKPIDGVEVCLRIANLLDTRRHYGRVGPTMPPPAEYLTGPGLEPFDTVCKRIESVLRAESIVPVLQPIVDVNTLQPVGFEALARFPGSSARTPDVWFSDAAAIGLGTELELAAAASAMAQIGAIPEHAFLALNMSPTTLLQGGGDRVFPPELGHRLVIELTEHVRINDHPDLDRRLVSLRAQGVRISADDVGAGYAGFTHLVRLRPDIIKLDISLVKDIQFSSDQRSLARALAAFARDVGAEVIAEGVETPDELEVLRELGITWAQGFHLGRPRVVPVSTGLCSFVV